MVVLALLAQNSMTLALCQLQLSAFLLMLRVSVRLRILTMKALMLTLLLVHERGGGRRGRGCVDVIAAGGALVF